MRGFSGVLSRALLGPILAACSILPTGAPAPVVQAALDAIARHDLGGAAPLVCVARRDPGDFPFSLPGIFEPVGALPGFDVPRTLAVIELDVTGLTVRERSRGGDTAEVDVDGVLVERFAPAEVEALFRAYASESGQPLEQELLDQTLANVSRGPVEIPIRETVPLIVEDGAWRICPPAPTP